MADKRCEELLNKLTDEPLSKLITKAEMIVLEVMYENGGPMSMMEIQEACNRKNGIDWKPQTVSTFLRRLCDKGITTMERHGRVFLHELVLPYEKFTANLADDLVTRWFDGDMSKLFDIFVKNVRPLTKNEVNAIFGPVMGRTI